MLSQNVNKLSRIFCLLRLWKSIFAIIQNLLGHPVVVKKDIKKKFGLTGKLTAFLRLWLVRRFFHPLIRWSGRLRSWRRWGQRGHGWNHWVDGLGIPHVIQRRRWVKLAAIDGIIGRMWGIIRLAKSRRIELGTGEHFGIRTIVLRGGSSTRWARAMTLCRPVISRWMSTSLIGIGGILSITTTRRRRGIFTVTLP